MPGGATYNGTTLGTAAKVAPYYAIVAGRLLALNGDRLDFSNRDDPATFDATDFHLLPGGATGLGIVGLRDAALVFTTDGAWVISNMAYDLTDAPAMSSIASTGTPARSCCGAMRASPRTPAA
jgi:hypothetical protein